MEDNKKYVIFKYLDEPTRFFGLPLDEFVIIASVLLLGFLFKFLIFALLLDVLIWMGMKRLKRNGNGNLMCWIYFYSTSDISKMLFKAFPPADKRYWT